MLVQGQELIAYMSGVNLNAPQSEQAELALSGVQAELETYLNRPLELTQIRETARTDITGVLNLSVSPVYKIINLTAVGYNMLPPPMMIGNPYIPSPMERDDLIGDDGKLIDTIAPAPVQVGNPLIVPGGVSIGVVGVYYVCEYIGGYNLTEDRVAYDGVRRAIMKVAARDIARHHDDSINLREGNAEKANDTDPLPLSWQEEELKKWDRLKRRTVV